MMNKGLSYGIIKIPCIAVRTEASERSEMSSQLLFGEIFEILEELRGWLFIRNEYDSYEGWISRSGIAFLNTEELDPYRNYSKCVQPYSFLSLQRATGEERMNIPAGSMLYFDKKLPLKVHCGDSYRMEKPCQNDTTEFPEKIIKISRRFLNTPYLWGGKSTYGTDCSGLVQTILKITGVPLARDTSLQVTQGSAVNMLAEAKTGDLVFFDNEEGEIVHVGILMETGLVLHASGMVRIDPIDHQGIYSAEQKRYTHKLRVIKRILNT